MCHQTLCHSLVLVPLPKRVALSALHSVPLPPPRFADVDEASKKEVKDILLAYDRTLLVADPRHREAKKFGGNARGKVQKSYR